MKSLPLFLALALIAGAIYYLQATKPIPTKALEIPIILTGTSTNQNPAPEEKKGKFPRAKEITSPSGFINTPNDAPITLEQFIGKKVILLDIWTYSCINCQRTLPHIVDWDKKYKGQGLQIIGIHTPEFDFEKIKTNVERATRQYGILYPVVLDNDYGTWTAYSNRYWPRKYLVDIDGYIVYDHIGEGAYDTTEKKIQELLKERSERLGEKFETPIVGGVPEAKIEAGSPETYFGSARNEYFGNGAKGISGEQIFTLPETFSRNTLYLGGTWNIAKEYAENRSGGEKIIFRYRAKNVFLVAGSETEVKLKILVDGKLVVERRGVDVNKASEVLVKDERLYKIIEGEKAEEHTLEIIIEKPGLRAFAFTFG